MTTGQIALVIMLIIVAAYIVTWIVGLFVKTVRVLLSKVWQIFTIVFQVLIGILIIIAITYLVGVYIEPIREIMEDFFGAGIYNWV